VTLTLSQIALALRMTLSCPDAIVTGWSTDSRTIAAGEFFFPLSGPNHDGHLHLDEAFRGGAIAAVVDREVSTKGLTIRVANTLSALQDVAAWAREDWGGDVIGVTGSVGKTSTKEILARLLEGEIPTGKTAGNFNNHVGLPLSILRLPRDSRVAVLELGMNHAGEIRDLAAIAKPRIAVVTNVGYAHIENFDSIDGIAAAKRELVDALPADGIAVLNADDVHVAAMAQGFKGKTITYGIVSNANVQARDCAFTATGVRFTVDGVNFDSPVAGRHNILNILAGVAVGREYGISLPRMAEAARALPVLKMRGERSIHNGVTIWNDSYNANPDAMRAMIDVLRDTSATRRIAVLGEMRELGAWSQRLHADTGAYTAQAGIDIVIAVHGAAQHLAEAAVSAGLPKENVHFVADSETAGELLKQIARPGDAILFKGSRGTAIERALERYLA
jgi:UDP-N-acetylmuramoyl-tripeptide--D-alanyl-D-alanine ligase